AEAGRRPAAHEHGDDHLLREINCRRGLVEFVLSIELRPLRFGSDEDLLRVLDAALIALLDRARTGAGRLRHGHRSREQSRSRRDHRPGAATGGVTSTRSSRSTGGVLPSRDLASTFNTYRPGARSFIGIFVV